MLLNKLGKIDIAPEVISALAGQTALQCNGVASMTARKLGDLFGKSSLGRGVKVLVLEDGTIGINLYILIKYGMKVSEVLPNVMTKVKQAVESTTGLKVGKVNVFVKGVYD